MVLSRDNNTVTLSDAVPQPNHNWLVPQAKLSLLGQQTVLTLAAEAHQSQAELQVSAQPALSK